MQEALVVRRETHVPAPPAAVFALLTDPRQILRWMGKPVLLLLNQTGQSRGARADAADEARWSGQLAEYVQSRSAVTLDAFARCWVQEDRLLDEASKFLPPGKQAASAS